MKYYFISCTGPDGISRLFIGKYSCNHQLTGNITHNFSVASNFNNLTLGHSFSLILDELGAGSQRVNTITHNQYPDYIGKGIPDTLIPMAAKYLNATIISSNNANSANGYRTTSASKAWDRLVKSGKAQYNNLTDTYSTIKHSPALMSSQSNLIPYSAPPYTR